jgi:hypothetical protein
MDYKQIKILTIKRKEKNMKEFMKKGISTLPVVNEILFFVLLAHEVIGLAKDWYKTRKSSTENKPATEEPEKK